MQIYPAVQAKIGRWHYYLARMSMLEISQNIGFAEDIHGATELSQAIQRGLKKSRSTSEIAQYLARHEDRFFSSIVVAALGCDPQWHSVSLEDDPQFNLLGRGRLTEAFGVLTFDGTEKYYALDGQHRLFAIKHLLSNETNYSPDPNFRDEEVSVLIVTPQQLEDEESFIVRYRRLFGHLNRYAKPMSDYDNIIMDEDDAIAIATRRLISDHPFFRSATDSDFDHSRIYMEAGKNIKAGSNWLTTLEVFYKLNTRLLLSRERRNKGWGEGGETLKIYQRFRPSEEEIDLLADELTVYWDALIHTLPMLGKDGALMRDHTPPELRLEDKESQDCVLFWPIVQVLLVDLARELFDDAIHRLGDDSNLQLSLEQAKHAIAPLSNLNWDAHSVPWRHVLLVPANETEDKWRIAAGPDRKQRLVLMEKILRWQAGIVPLIDEETERLRQEWYGYLPATAVDEAELMWTQIKAGVIP